MHGDESLNDLLKTKEYKESNAVLPVILGMNAQNKVVIEDLRDVFSILQILSSVFKKHLMRLDIRVMLVILVGLVLYVLRVW